LIFGTRASGVFSLTARRRRAYPQSNPHTVGAPAIPIQESRVLVMT